MIKRAMLCGMMALATAGAAVRCAPSPVSETSASSAAALVFDSGLRRPQGLYAKVALASLVTNQGDWSTYLGCYFDNLLANPAVSGLELNVNWSEISPTGPSAGNQFPTDDQLDWRNVEAAFAAVHKWNTTNRGSTPKSIQLIVVPGFNSPSWLLNGLTLCDPLFYEGYAQYPCSAVTIQGYSEGDNKSTIWPLPWDPTYKQAWYHFLGQLNTKYGANTDLVSLSMGGPTGTSDEMYVPHESKSGHFGATTQKFVCHNCACPKGGPCPVSASFSINEVMQKLIANWAHYSDNPESGVGGWPSPYEVVTGTDDVFVTEWRLAIAQYAATFTNLTLILTPAEGNCFPSFGPVVPDGGLYTQIFDQLCQEADGGAGDMSCATTAQIIANFEATKFATNGKGSQMSGLGTPIAQKGSDTNTQFGIRGVRFLAATTASEDPYNQIVGGAQFTGSFLELDADTKQCTPAEWDSGACTFQQVVFNVLGTAFYDTAAGPSFGHPAGNQPLNFIQLFDTDYLRASSKAGANEVTVETEDGGTRDASLQGLVNQAYLSIGQVSMPPVPMALWTGDGGPAQVCVAPDAGSED